MDEYLGMGQTARILKLSRATIHKHHRAGALPHTEIDGRLTYPRSFVDGLAEASNDIPITREFVQLYRLAWEYYNGTTTLQQTLAQTNNLRRQEAILTIGETSSLLGYSRRSMVRWRNKGWIRSIRISHRHFTLRSDINRLRKLIGSMTSYEIANALELPFRTIHGRIRSGKIRVSRTPGGEFRANPDDILALAESRKAEAATYSLSIADAEKILGVPGKTIFYWTDKSILSSMTMNGLRFLLPGEIEVLAKQFQTITPGFEWLNTCPVDPRQKQQLWTAEKTARYLRVSIKLVRKLAKEGLFPSYPRTPAGLACVNRVYVAAYATGLKAFAGTRKITTATVEEYNVACQEKQLVA